LIILHTLRKYLLDLRLVISLLVIIILISLSGLYYSHEINQRQKVYNRLNTLARDESSIESIEYVKKPSKLTFLSEGGEKGLPDVFRITPFLVEEEYKKIDALSYLKDIVQPDWTFMVGVFISLLALLLTYSEISGERESGILALTLSNPVRKSDLLLGKYISVVVFLSVLLVMGLLIDILILRVMGNVYLSISDFYKILIIFTLSVLFISLISLMGIFCSILFKNSSISLLFALLIWIAFIFIIPNLSFIAGEYVRPSPSPIVLEENIRIANEQFRGRTGVSTSSLESIVNQPIPDEQKRILVEQLQKEIYDEHFSVRTERRSAEAKLRKDFQNKIKEQIRLKFLLAKISPFFLYQNLCEMTGGTGYAHQIFLQRFAENIKEQFQPVALAQQKQYLIKESDESPSGFAWLGKSRLNDLLRPGPSVYKKGEIPDALDMLKMLTEDGAFVIKSLSHADLSNIKLEEAQFKIPEEPEAGMPVNFGDYLWGIFYMIMLNIIFFLISFVLFIRYDPRF
ncbi:MAG: ABC transporter permease, partial [Acidobacteriota bacterium]